MKKIEKSKLIITGAVFTAVSFLYEYAFPFQSAFLTAMIIVSDIILLLLNFHFFTSLIFEAKKKAVLNTVLCSLVYFLALSGLVMMLAEEKASLQVLLVTFETLVYLGPSFILLLPVYRVIAEISG